MGKRAAPGTPQLRDAAQRRELAAFLRSARDRVQPADVGLPVGARRRAPGLLREEVAQLAAISSSWYGWLEQGRRIHVSEQVLAAVAVALRLDDAATEHLFRLAGQRRPADGPRTGRPDHALRILLDQLREPPAYVIDRRWNILDWNPRAAALFGEPFDGVPEADRNALRYALTGRHARLRFTDPVEMAVQYIGQFRADTAEFIGQPDFDSQIATLAADSSLFRRLWPRQEVHQRPSGPMHYVHDDVGELTFEFLALQLGDHAAHRVHVYLPTRDSDTAAQLDALDQLYADRVQSDSSEPGR